MLWSRANKLECGGSGDNTVRRPTCSLSPFKSIALLEVTKLPKKYLLADVNGIAAEGFQGGDSRFYVFCRQRRVEHKKVFVRHGSDLCRECVEPPSHKNKRGAAATHDSTRILTQRGSLGASDPLVHYEQPILAPQLWQR